MDLERLSVREVLRLHADVLAELRRRGAVRSANGPAGDYAELLVAQALGLTLAQGSARGYDATDELGHKFQIKGRRITPENGSRQLSAIRGLDSKPFDFLVGVLFDWDFSVRRACLMPRDVVLEVATYRPWVNAWIMHLRDELWDRPGVKDVTDRPRIAAEGRRSPSARAIRYSACAARGPPQWWG